MKKVIVVGGGASGLVAAIVASNKCDVTIIEKNSNCGKKILVTGNGKCNYFNEDFDVIHYNDLRLNKIITEDNKKMVLGFFEELGIVAKVKNGYYYPYSNQAVSIQNALLTEIKNRNIKVITDTVVQNIKYNNNFIIETNNGIYESDKVILATGSIAFYSDECLKNGYSIAKKFNHTIKEVLPGLTALRGSESYYKEWNGIRCDAKLSLYIDDNFIKEEVGELQLTNYGISGICTMQLSNKCVPYINTNNVHIIINFLDFLGIKNKDDFKKYLENRNNLLKGRNISELFDSLLNYKLTNLLLKISKINFNKQYDELSKKDIDILASNMVNFDFKVVGYNSYKEAQICLGGVSLSEINIDTMESLNQKGLYIVGELLDVNGDCGGFNLGFAFLSGMLAGGDVFND